MAWIDGWLEELEECYILFSYHAFLLSKVISLRGLAELAPFFFFLKSNLYADLSLKVGEVNVEKGDHCDLIRRFPKIYSFLPKPWTITDKRPD